MRKLKKGFTIIELVIVIAVIAVLTAVLVPTFVHLSKKARDTNDKSIVTSANIQLAAQEGLQGKNRSMSEAVKDVDEIGYHMSTVPTGNDNKIVWDSVTDRFVLLDKDNNPLLSDGEVSSHDKLFYPVSSISEAGDFAIYAKSNFEGTETEFSFTSPKSFDAGEKEGITKVSYDFTDVGSVLVVTNSEGTELDVKAPNADFEHADLCGKIIIESVDDDTFRDYGHVGYVEIDSGHYVADSGSNIKAVYATSENAKVDKQNGGQIENAYGGAASYTGDNSKGNVELDFSELENRGSIAEQAIEDLKHEVNPQPTPIHVLTPEDIAAQNEGKKILVDGVYKTGITADVDNFFFMGSHSMKLIDDISLPGLGLLGSASCDLDLNGYSVLLTDGMNIVNSATLNIRDSSGESGVWGLDTTKCCGYGLIGVDANLNIYGGRFDATGVGEDCIGSMGGNAKVTIYGGTFIADAGHYCIEPSNTTIHGGTFRATAEGSAIFRFKESQKSIDMSEATIVSGSKVYRDE